jgi:hypothetical protein
MYHSAGRPTDKEYQQNPVTAENDMSRTKRLRISGESRSQTAGIESGRQGPYFLIRRFASIQARRGMMYVVLLCMYQVCMFYDNVCSNDVSLSLRLHTSTTG